jgi:branched-chain amino acid transport system substrate-binding protein
MINRLRGSWVFVLMLLIGLLFATGLQAPAMAQSGPIKIGILNPMTGVLAANGNDMSEGQKIYLDEINYKIAGREIQVTWEDTASNVNTGLTKARKLIERNKVHVILGPIHSGVALAMNGLVNAKKVPQVISQATANVLTGAKASPYVFRTSYASSQIHMPMGKYLVNKLGWKKIGIMALDYTPGHEQADGFIKGYKLAGGKVVLELYPNLGATDMAPYLAKIKAQADELDGFVAILWTATAIHFIKGYSEFGLKSRIPLLAFGSTVDESFLPTLGDTALGLLNHQFWGRQLDNPANRKLKKAVRRMFKRPAANNHDLGYVNVKVVGEALKAINGKVEDQKAFLSALRRVKFNAPRGPFSFDEKQNAILTVYVRRVAKVGDGLDHVIIDSFPNISQSWRP